VRQTMKSSLVDGCNLKVMEKDKKEEKTAEVPTGKTGPQLCAIFP